MTTPARQRTITPVAELLGADDRFVTVEGHRLHYLARGEGPAVVLVHGFAGSTAAWESVTAELARDHSVYAIDLLGFGLSDKPARADHCLAGHGRRTVALLAALGLEAVTLVGHSMGGVVAAQAALADTEGRIARLALLDANFYRRNGPPLPMVPPLARLLAARFYAPAARAASLRRCFADLAMVTPELLERYLAPTRTPGALEALAAFLATPGPPTYADLPPRLRMPTLILWGERDALWPLSDAERLRREIAGSALATIAGAGHMLPEERPAEVAAQLRVWITREPGAQ